MRQPAQFVAGALLALAGLAQAQPVAVAFDYRCGDAASTPAELPVGGWQTAATGNRPPSSIPCWLRIDLAPLAPRLLQISGSRYDKTSLCSRATGGYSPRRATSGRATGS